MTAGMTVHDSLGRPVALHKELSHSDTDAFYSVERRPEVIAKIALDPLESRQQERLRALVAARSSALEDVSTWPLMTLHDRAGQVVGFMMLRLDVQDDQFLASYTLPPRITPRNLAERVSLAARTAKAFDGLHGAGQVMGNVHGQQVVVSARGQVRLVNVDTYQASLNGQVIPGAPTRPQFTAPELQGKGKLLPQTQNHDLFGLAVLIFRLLMAGEHPYSGVPVGGPMPSPGAAIAADLFAYSATPRPGVRQPPGTPGLDTLTPAVAALFERAFSVTHGHRPTAREWHAALTDMQTSLEACPVNPAHTCVRGQACQTCQTDTPAGEDSGEGLVDLKGNLARLWQQVQGVRAPDRPATTGAPELPNTPPLPPLPLNLPNPPRSLVRPAVVEGLFRWLVRLGIVALIFAVVYAVQKSALAALLEIGLVIFVLTLGRRFSVDWDGMIVNFQNWEGRMLERYLPGNRRWESYYAAVDARRQEYRTNFKNLRTQYAALEEQYRDHNAFARYQAALTALDARRRRLMQTKQGDTVQSLLSEYRQEALNEYLRQQPLQPGVVPELTSKAALHLSTLGVRRAADLQPDKLKVVRPELAAPLLAWRDDLVGFFQFNEDSVPAGRLAQARHQQQMGQRSEFRQFEQDARKFMTTDWHAQEHQFLEQLREVKAQARQQQQALKNLEELAGR